MQLVFSYLQAIKAPLSRRIRLKRTGVAASSSTYSILTMKSFALAGSSPGMVALSRGKVSLVRNRNNEYLAGKNRLVVGRTRDVAALPAFSSRADQANTFEKK